MEQAQDTMKIQMTNTLWKVEEKKAKCNFQNVKITIFIKIHRNHVP